MRVLTPQQLAALSPGAPATVQAMRQWTGLQQAVAQQALSHSQQSLRGAAATDRRDRRRRDQKAILDLQARIGAELGMLQNEQTKLQMFAESSAHAAMPALRSSRRASR